MSSWLLLIIGLCSLGRLRILCPIISYIVILFIHRHFGSSSCPLVIWFCFVNRNMEAIWMKPWMRTLVEQISLCITLILCFSFLFSLNLSFFFPPAFQNYKQLIIMSLIFFKLVLLLCFMVQCISTTSLRPTTKFYCWQQWESSWTRTFSIALCCKKLQAFIAIWSQLQERHYKPYWCCWICWSIINTITSRSSYGPSYRAQHQAWAASSFSAEA